MLLYADNVDGVKHKSNKLHITLDTIDIVGEEGDGERGRGGGMD